MLESWKTKTKYGFSLFEVVLTMAIVAIFIASCSSIFTGRHKKRVAIPNHGRYECYYDKDSSQLMQRTFSGNALVSSGVVPATGCDFTPPTTAHYLIINSIGGGGHGGDNYGGSAGEYKSLFLSSTEHKLRLRPGMRAETPEVTGVSTLIFDMGTDGNGPERLMLEAKGGLSDSGAAIDFAECVVSYTKYKCGVEAHCDKDTKNGKKYLNVTFCTETGTPDDPRTESARTVQIPYNGEYGSGSYDTGDTYDDHCNSHFADSSRIYSLYSTLGGQANLKDNASNVFTYNYTKQYCDGGAGSQLFTAYETLFTLNLTVLGNYTIYQDTSPLMGYINTLRIVDGIGETDANYALPGTGGSRGNAGSHGAVLITW